MMKPVKRTPGRPPLDDEDPSVGVYVSLPSKDFDDICRRAQDAGVSAAEIIRRDLQDRELKYKK